MLIYIGADHRGFALKENLKKYLTASGYEVVDFGSDTLVENDDYVDIAARVGQEIAKDPAMGRGILLCGSGVGMDVVVNKFRHVRASLCMSPDHAMAARGEDDANVLVLGAEFITEDMAKKIIAVWLQTPFKQEERYARRIQKLEELEKTIKSL